LGLQPLGTGARLAPPTAGEDQPGEPVPDRSDLLDARVLAREVVVRVAIAVRVAAGLPLVEVIYGFREGRAQGRVGVDSSEEAHSRD
jgi:hypothetical protein